MNLIYQGAEAKIFKENDSVVKDRFSKQYRHPEIDKRLRKSRTKREAKVLQKIEGKIPSCSYIEHSDIDMTIKMKFIEGPMLKEVFNEDYEKYSKMIAKNIILLHKEGIIHGDLTTSNMIYNDKLYFIDFGLSFFSEKKEDRAVDLHLLKHALESKHFEVADKAFKIILDMYPDKDVIERLDIVEKRGRYKQQY